MSHIERGIEQHHTNIPKNILKTVSYTKNKPKDTIQKGINKKGHKWFWHTTVRFNSNGNFKIRKMDTSDWELKKTGETGETTELGQIGSPLGRFAWPWDESSHRLGRFASRWWKSMGWAMNSVIFHKNSVKCRMCMATIHMLFQVRTWYIGQGKGNRPWKWTPLILPVKIDVTKMSF